MLWESYEQQYWVRAEVCLVQYPVSSSTCQPLACAEIPSRDKQEHLQSQWQIVLKENEEQQLCPPNPIRESAKAELVSTQTNRPGLQWLDAFFLFTSFRIKASQGWEGLQDHGITEMGNMAPWQSLPKQAEMQEGLNKTQAVPHTVQKVRGCKTLPMTTPGMTYRTWSRMLLKSKDVRLYVGKSWASEQLPVGDRLLRRLPVLTISTQLPLSYIQTLLDSQCNHQKQLSFM